MKLDGVFEGGGIKGICYVGAKKCLEEYGYEFNKVAGTSAGSFVSALIAAGYTADEMKSILLDFNFIDLNGLNRYNNIPLIGKPLSLLIEKGLYNTDKLEKFVYDLLKAKGITKFSDVKKDGDYKLKIIAANVSRHEVIILPDDLHKYGIDPDKFSIARAVTMSCAIPFYFEPLNLFGDLVVDGGIVSSYPIWIFDINGKPRWPTLGFVINELNSISKEKSILGFVTNIIETALNRDQAIYDDIETLSRTIKIPVRNISATDFNLTKSKKIELYKSGYEATKRFLDNWNFEDYKKRYRS